MNKRIAKKRYKKVLAEVATTRRILKDKDKLLEQYAYTIDLQEVEVINLKNCKAVLENRLIDEIEKADGLFVENRQLTSELSTLKTRTEDAMYAAEYWRRKYGEEKSKPWWKKVFKHG